ncbi:hypothetical protein DI005_20010 [Prauserella sp. PE36]|nr:hypothetical protein DI005_20010 [Prauserella sp. PE36]
MPTSPWRLRWQNHCETKTEKLRAKHAGKMAYLRDHRDDISERTRRRREKWAHTLDSAAAGIAAAGRAGKGRFAAAKDAMRKRREGTDTPAEPTPGDDTAPGGRTTTGEDRPGATVLPFQRPVEPINLDAISGPIAPDSDRYKPTAPVASSHAQAEPDTEDGRAVLDERPLGQYGSAHQRLLQAAKDDPDSLDLSSEDEFTQDGLADLRAAGCLSQDNRLTEFGARELARLNNNGSRIVGGDPADGARHDEFPHLSPNQEVATMTAPAATEITDLHTARQFSEATAKYGSSVAAELADVVAQLQTYQQGMATEAHSCDGGSANLTGAGFGPKITGAFDASSEKLNIAADALKKAFDAVVEAQEACDAVSGEMQAATNIFAGQENVADTLGAHAQAEGVATNTGFYTGAAVARA